MCNDFVNFYTLACMFNDVGLKDIAYMFICIMVKRPDTAQP